MTNYKEMESCANGVQDSHTKIYERTGGNLAVTSHYSENGSLADLMFELIKQKINAH